MTLPLIVYKLQEFKYMGKQNVDVRFSIKSLYLFYFIHLEKSEILLHWNIKFNFGLI